MNKEKYGLLTAISMIVGIVIGSGIFFKADDILSAVGGNVILAILAIVTGGLIMLFGAYSVSFIAGKNVKSSGLIDYVELGYGKRVAYYVGLFASVVYFPSLVSIVSYVSANYTIALFHMDSNDVWLLSFIYLVLSYVFNYVSPLLAGYFQVSTMMIKLIPVALVFIFGLIYGQSSGTLYENLSSSSMASGGGGFALALLSTAFLYDGWIVSTSINSEIKNPKKNMPKALVIGSTIVILAYVGYYAGLFGVLNVDEFLFHQDQSVFIAVERLFGQISSKFLMVFVVISCLGTLNGLSLASIRGLYQVYARFNEKTKMINVSQSNGMPKTSFMFSMAASLVYLVVFYGNELDLYNGVFDLAELSVGFLYLVYAMIYIYIIRHEKSLSKIKRFIFPIGALIGSGFILFATTMKYGFWMFLLFNFVILLIGYVVKKHYRLTFKEEM